MVLYKFDPIQDRRWREFLERHPRASVFHTPQWLEALRRTYAYTAIGYTSSAPGEEIRNGLVFCGVDSWLTGRRIVSLPFSDHCEPLVDSVEEMEFFARRLQAKVKPQKFDYVEVRPINGSFDSSGEQCGFRPATSYRLHRIDLQPNLNNIHQGFDKDSVVRRIRRAERAGLTEKSGASKDLLKDFYGLLIRTRARHAVPPQPYAWYQNLIDCMGGLLSIRLAYQAAIPIAAILTLRFRDMAVYKYGCSDERYKNLGAMPLLLWRAIEESKSTGAKEFSLGRSDEDNVGLIAFKDHWTRHSTSLVYWRCPGPQSVNSKERWAVSAAKKLFAVMPGRIQAATGKLIYRHIG